MIQNNAKEIYSSVGDGAGKEFVANRGWLEKCLKRNDLSLRRRTTMAQKDPDLLTGSLVRPLLPDLPNMLIEELA
ncbi:hypothetical protein CRUP_018180 [Coryphaenoides rupestris]|nr:hypothetical protein CRUP_018180 [Coryphaenoides rupestris]